MGFITKDPYVPLKNIKGTKYWKNEKDIVYFSRKFDLLVFIPTGYISDGASIPKIFWFVIGHPLEEYYPAAFIHDSFYDGTKPLERFNKSERRKIADQILKEACTDLKVSNWKVFLIYFAVRCGGWWPWFKHRKRKQHKQEQTGN